MTRDEAKELLPIIQAYAEGKAIQFLGGGKWLDVYEADFHESTYKYRIKPEPKYRPFKTKEECWNEMLKHQPFGWVKHKVTCGLIAIGAIDKSLQITSATFDMESLFNNYIFADGAPFGIKED